MSCHLLLATENNLPSGLPANINARFIRSYKTYDNCTPKWNGIYKNINCHIRHTCIKSTQKYLLLAFSGFLEDGRHRRPVRSSSKKKNLWYCLEFERIFINSEPFCMKVKQSAAAIKKKLQINHLRFSCN